MALFGLIKPAVEASEPMVPAHRLDTLALQYERLEESLASLRREDIGWKPLTGLGADLISREELGAKADTLRGLTVANPLLRRALGVRTGYVWGTGVTISAAEQEKGQDVDAVVQGFLTDERNEAACFGAEAREEAEGDLFSDGNHFRAHFVDRMTGHVQVRPLPFNEITQIMTAPGDRFTPHYYLREWTEAGYGLAAVQRKAWYPDLRHQPRAKPKLIDGIEVLWPGDIGGAAILHVSSRTAGRGSRWGIPDAYAAAPFAIRYEGFLSDWLTLVKALSKVAWQVVDPNGKSQQMRAAAQAVASMQGAGGTIATGTGELKAPNVSGATVDADSGRPIVSLVAAALDLPVTMLTADPGTTGARAVAETLDKPTKDAMRARQRLWEAADRASIQFVIEQHVIAPRGSLKGRVVPEDDRMTVEFTDATEVTINVVWPDMDEPDVKAVLDALQVADDLGVLPMVELAKLVLHALRVPNVAELIDKMTDDAGEWVDQRDNDEQVGAALAGRYRAGKPPAPDDEPETE
ncbi:hypothetical protein [Galactobacter valiniphilus]|uniref:hypothetical protein n=1 Tax=Galactobacter valiniphilus TaxID=2676122 RepID=UPI003736BED2